MDPLSSERTSRGRWWPRLRRAGGRAATAAVLAAFAASPRVGQAQNGAPALAQGAAESEGAWDLLGERRVVSGVRGRGDFPDVRLEIAWLRQDRRATVSRERADQSTGGEVGRAADLTHRQTRQVLLLGAELGVVRDLSVFVEAPLVLADDRWLHFDDGVDAGSSTLLRDGILPGAGSDRYGLDAPQGRPFERPADTVFRGPTRRGLEYLGLGVSYAIMNQRRDESRPTWVVRAEPRLALGKAMAFDPGRPEANRAVNPGYHQLVISTFFSRRIGRALPHLGGFWAIPKGLDSGGYGRFPLGREGFAAPPHRAGAEAGLEYEAFARAAAGHRVLLELGLLAELRFFGLARSELWEPLSGNSSCPAVPASCRPEIDVDLDGDLRADAYPGLVRSPSYGRFGGRAGAAFEIARRVRLTAGVTMTAEQERFLTDGRSGVESFDRPGRRFKVEEARAWELRLNATAGF